MSTRIRWRQMMYFTPDDLQTVWVHRCIPLDHPVQAQFHIADGTFSLTVWNWNHTASLNISLPMQQIHSWRPLT